MSTEAVLIEVFKTNIAAASDACGMITALARHFPNCRISIDTEDCDKVLRIEGSDFDPYRVIALVNQNGYCCAVLE